MESCMTQASVPLVSAAVARRCRAASSRAGRCVGAAAGTRVGLVERATKETSVSVRIDLDGTGVCVAASGIPFLDHLLDVSRQRNTADMVSAVNSNPLMASQNLAYNAEHDEKLLQEMLATM